MRDDQVRRYARHILLPDVGGTGQRRLLGATAVVRDASGAAAVAVAYLAAAGVGTIVIDDDGVVAAGDVGALYEKDDVGAARGEAARRRVRELNPDVRVARRGEGDPVLPEPAPESGGDPAWRLLAGARAALAFIERTLAS
jgi:adenylyltransferase/sulfurtransferase